MESKITKQQRKFIIKSTKISYDQQEQHYQQQQQQQQLQQRNQSKCYQSNYHHLHHHHQKYSQISPLSITTKNNNNNEKSVPLRTTSLYAISSSSLFYKDNNYDADDDDDDDNDSDDDDDDKSEGSACSSTSSPSSHSQLKPSSSSIFLPEISNRNDGYHRCYHRKFEDNNYRLPSSLSYHNRRQFSINTSSSHYPLIKMTSIIERRSSSVEKEVIAPTTAITVVKDNYHHSNSGSSNGILREKTCNNEILNSNNYNNELISSSSPSSWLCSNNVDALKEKIRESSTAIERKNSYYNNRYDRSYQNNHQRHNGTTTGINERYRRLENEKYDFVDASTEKRTKSGIRTRSESEPNDICNMRQWLPQTAITTVDEEIHQRSINEQQQKQREYSSSNKLPPKYPQNYDAMKRATPSPPKTPPRLSIYTTSSRSPNIIRKPASSRIQSSSAATNSQHSPRRHLNNITSGTVVTTRRCRTKSPSPTYNKGNKYYGSIGVTASAATQIRKTRSVTPPPKKSQSLPPPSLPRQPSSERGKILSSKWSSKKSTPSSTHRNYKNYDSHGDNSSEDENDDDDDFEDDFNDDDEDVNSSSDSENGYRTHVYTNNFEKSSSTSSFNQYSSNISSTNNSALYAPPSSILIPSLFPNVPPYLAFSTDRDKGPLIPPHVHKILKWKLTTIMPKVVRRVLINSGFRLLKKTNDWMGTWGKHMKSPCFRTIRSYQKINHLPGSFKIGRKDSCWKNLQIQMIKHGKKEFGFMPKTYIIPQDLKMLRKSWPKYAQRNFKWIIKPPASARGTGIKVVNRWSQIPKRKPMIVQRYIERPFLINGSKFDLRLYVLVTSINPLRVYLYHDGLVRFASVKYSEKSDTLSDRCMHLTNYSINKFSSNYAKNEDVYACHGHKWTIKSLWAFFEKRNINTNRLWGAFRNLILRTLLAGESAINAMIKMNVESKYNCFELFGFDILLDSELVPWLLEVNISPSLHSELPLDLHVKAPLVQAVLNTALYHIPPKLSIDQQRDLLNRSGLQGPLCFDKRLYVTYLSRAEKLKHQQFTRKSLEDRDDYLNDILENLTPDDIRCLITSEDELSRSTPLERIFPTQNTYKYLKYTETPRYYNRLLDAWEYRYGKDRLAGRNLLKELCEQKLHLDTPPAPMKRDFNDAKLENENIKSILVSSNSSNKSTFKTEQKKISANEIETKSTTAAASTTKLQLNNNNKNNVIRRNCNSNNKSSLTRNNKHNIKYTTIPKNVIRTDNSSRDLIENDDDGDCGKLTSSSSSLKLSSSSPSSHSRSSFLPCSIKSSNCDYIDCRLVEQQQ